MPVDFPSNPNIGQTASSSEGVIWTFDGIAWRVKYYVEGIESVDSPDTVLIASSSGGFGLNSQPINIFSGSSKDGWNSTSWDFSIDTDLLIPIEYSNVGIPIPVDLPVGSELRLCGKATNEYGREIFYHGLGVFNCDDLVGDGVWYYQISLLTSGQTSFQVIENIEEGPTYSEACFSLTYITTAPMNRCRDYIVVALGDSTPQEEEENTTKFTWTLEAIINPDNCCEGPLRLFGAGLTEVNGTYYLLDFPINNLPPEIETFGIGWNGESFMFIGLIYDDPFYVYIILLYSGDNIPDITIFGNTASYGFYNLSSTPNFTPCLWNGNWEFSEAATASFLPIPIICGNTFSTDCQPFFKSYSYSDFGSFIGYVQFVDVYIFYFNLSNSSGFIPSDFVVSSISYSFGPSGFLIPQLPPIGVIDASPFSDIQVLFTIGGDSFAISGSGESLVNDIYYQTGTSSGKPVYSGVSNGIIVTWDGSQWIIEDVSDTLYYSDDNVATPNLVTTWLADVGLTPLPTIVNYIYDSGEDIDCILNNPEECAPTYYFYELGKPNCPPGIIFWVPEE
jgi:hypothetical protein